MRRGLIARSIIELPDAVLDARLTRLRAAMREARLDALLVYTNNTRPAGVSWLTGFVPYWSEALLVLPPQRDPVLVVALTYRVKSWIERVSRVSEVIHTPRIGLEAARLLAATKGDAAVGIVDRDGLPAGVADDLREGGRHLSWHDATALFAPLRAQADPAEITLAVKAAEIARHALDRAGETTIDLAARVAAVEREARLRGAEEIYVAVAPDLARARHLVRIEGAVDVGASFALRATVAYKGVWIRLTRTFETTGGAAAAERFAAAVAQLPDARGLAAFPSWSVEGCRIAQPLEPLMGSRLDDPIIPAPRSLVSVQACLAVDGTPHLIGAPALLGSAGEAASILGQPIS